MLKKEKGPVWFDLDHITMSEKKTYSLLAKYADEFAVDISAIAGLKIFTKDERQVEVGLGSITVNVSILVRDGINPKVMLRYVRIFVRVITTFEDCQIYQAPRICWCRCSPLNISAKTELLTRENIKFPIFRCCKHTAQMSCGARAYLYESLEIRLSDAKLRLDFPHCFAASKPRPET